MPPRSSSPPAQGRGYAPGTCGELAQGVLPGGQRFHVTCPIDRGSTIEVERTAARVLTIEGLGPEERKITAALIAAGAELGLSPATLRVSRRTQLATGKGMASSSADIVAAARALAASAAREFSPEALARLAASIESSDGVMFDGLCAVDQRTGALVRRWDWWPQFVIAMAVPAASRDTASVSFDGLESLAPTYAALLHALDTAVATRDAGAFARESTRSAELNERFVESAMLAALAPAAPRLGALGVCVGHTGTLAGLLFDAGDDGEAAASAAAADLAARLPAGVAVSVVRTPPCPVTSPRSNQPLLAATTAA